MGESQHLLTSDSGMSSLDRSRLFSIRYRFLVNHFATICVIDGDACHACQALYGLFEFQVSVFIHHQRDR